LGQYPLGEGVREQIDIIDKADTTRVREAWSVGGLDVGGWRWRIGVVRQWVGGETDGWMVKKMSEWCNRYLPSSSWTLIMSAL
jgi:hypothetical protein